jgi:hypothetical protein
MFNVQNPSYDIRQTLVTAQLANMLPKSIDLTEISLCAKDLIEQLDMFQDSPAKKKDLVN